MSAPASERTEAPQTGKGEGSAAGVIVVDMGKQKRKDIKGLKEGTGKLMEEVRDTLTELRGSGTISNNAQPIVLIVRERRRRPKFWF